MHSPTFVHSSPRALRSRTVLPRRRQFWPDNCIEQTLGYTLLCPWKDVCHFDMLGKIRSEAAER